MKQRSLFGACAKANTQTDALQVAQTKLLYAGLPAAIIINALLALILVSVQSTVISPAKSFGWLARHDRDHLAGQGGSGSGLAPQRGGC